MRIFIIYRHYWPDTTPYGTLLRHILERLAADGHAVTVFTAQPSYNDIKHQHQPMREIIGGVRVIRMPLLWERKRVTLSRLLNTGLFVSGALVFGALDKRMDLVMTHSAPPVVMGWTARLLSAVRGARYLYHCQDLNPEALRFGGALQHGLVYRLMMALEKTSAAHADAVVVLSEDMADTVRARGLDGDNLHVLNNFTMESPHHGEAEVPEALHAVPSDHFRILFAGNHGLFQGLEHVVAAAHRLKDEPRIQFHFLGEGLAKARLQADAATLQGKTVFFHPYVPANVAVKVMERSDLGLVPLQPDIYRVAYPSKTMMLMNAGLRLLVCVEPDSQLAAFVRDNDVGYVCAPGDAAAMVGAIRQAFASRKRGEETRRRVMAVAESHFGQEANLARWSSLIRGLEEARASS